MYNSVAIKKLFDFAFFASLMLILNVFIHDASVLSTIVFVLLGLQYSFGMVYVGPSKATLIKVFSLFGYIFFSILPVIELSQDRVYWGGEAFDHFDYAIAGAYLVIFNLIVFAVYFAFSGRQREISALDTQYDFSFGYKCFSLTWKGRFLIFAVALSSLYLVLNYNSFNLISPLVRGGELVTRETFESSYMNLIYGSVVRFLPMAIFLSLVFVVKGSYILKAIVFLIAVYCVFPLGIARLRVPTYYLPLFVLLIPSVLNNQNLLKIIAGGILFVFPFLENFRSYRLGDKLNNVTLSYDFLLAGHFDAFQNFARIVSIDFITYGRQLLGVLLFWVPRRFWNDKPVGTGFQLAEELNFSFGNISATFFAEGWANFGLLGAIAFSIILGCVLARLDTNFWLRHSKSSLFQLCYFVLLGYLFFFLRGDLLSSTAFLVGTIGTIWLSMTLIRISSKRLF